ncbi:mitochondrial 18 KDa protein-domain-containing protein [Phaeosphaeriaceae sp. PMI808]|nr:mitochondrial 18 KDa protein-domain-containing protein [Phaeosphaeriaceae sp. PMI808]
MSKPPSKDEFPDIPHTRSSPRPDFTTPPPRKHLPPSIQATLDNDADPLWDTLYEGYAADTTDTSLRYAAYATRIRTIMLSAHRYVAYTSDIGESFRPVAHPWLVRGAYGVSWAYLVGDVGHEGWKAYCRNQRVMFPEKYVEEKKDEVVVDEGPKGVFDSVKKVAKSAVGVGSVEGTGAQVVPGHVPAIEDYRAVMAQRAVFQGMASMGLPAFMIHSIVRYSGRAMKDVKNARVRTWGPIGLGLAAVPFLPYIFDEPVEHATEWIFYNGFKTFGGEKAVAGRPATGVKELREKESKPGHLKEL